MVTVEDFSRIVLTVYQAALCPANWPGVMAEISDALDATGCALITTAGPNRGPKCASIPTEARDSYRDYYCNVDYVLEAVEAGPVGVLRTGPEVIDPHAGTEFDADWMRPNDMRDGVFVRLTDAPVATSFLAAAPRRDSPFATIERMRFTTALLPHLQQALRTEEHLNRSCQDSDQHGAVIIGRDGAVLGANDRAHRILSGADGLALQDGSVEAARPMANAALRSGIAAVLQEPEHNGFRGHTMTCGRPSGRRPYVLHILPLRDEDSTDRALLLIVDSEQKVLPSRVVLQRLYGLTAAEARVALLLQTGLSPKTIADQLSLSITTIKTHLQHVYAKTDTHRQAELVGLLSRLSLG